MGGDCVLKGIQIRNLRGLKNTDMLSLSPITVLVGENSSGKSTFLRTFPLLKQSIAKRTSGPLLWAGDYDDYVDFGSFKAAVTNDGSNKITFTFSFDLDEGDAHRYSFSHFIFDNEFISKVIYEIDISSNDGKDNVDALRLTYNTHSILFDFSENEIFIDEEKIKYAPPPAADSGKEFERGMYFSSRRDTVISIFEFSLPNIAQVREKVFAFIDPKKTKSDTDRERDMSLYYIIDYIGMELLHGLDLTTIKTNVLDNIKKKNHIFIPFIEPDFLAKTILKIDRLAWAQKRAFCAAAILCATYSIYPCIESYIRTYFSNVHYIAPLRATAERYYRLRNLAVDEIDYQGKNLAVFLNSLSNKKLQNFQQWTMEHFGFSVTKSTSEGHLSLGIMLRDTKKSVNLSDTGFGYSQILPIITQLWELATRKSENVMANMPLVVAIEQPELHLHPAMQARLARAFIATIDLAAEHGYQMQLILETHSDTIVNYFGRAIAKGMLRAEDVSVVLFEKDINTNLTAVKTSTYSDEGYLQNWLYGFFNPGE